MSPFSSQKHSFKDLLFLVPLSLFFLLFRLGRGSLASWDEAIYASVAKEIFRSGDWLRLKLDGSLWFDKPPICIWATTFFYHLFGVTEFSARLFSALCGAGTVVVTYFFGRELLNRWMAFVGALVLLSSSHFLHFARFGMMDAPLTFFMTLSFYLFWLGISKNRYLIFSGVAIGLAVMTKGFAALFVFPVIWFYCIFSGRQEVLGRSSYWIGVMIAVLIALPWHLYEMVAYHGIFLHDVILRHLISRTTTVLDGHSGNWYFYVRTLVNKYHPWILVAILSAPYFLFKAVKDREDEIIFLTVWMFFIFGAMTLIRTKLDWYLLPVYPALSLSVAYFVAQMFREHHANFVRVMFAVVLVLHVLYSHIFNHDYSRDIKGIAPAVAGKVPADKAFYLYNYHEAPAVSFYLDRPSAYLDTKESFLAKAGEKNFYCLIRDVDLKPLAASLPGLGVSVQASSGNLRFVSGKS